MSEARGYIPMLTPQQVVLASKNLPPVSAESAPSSSTTAMATSGVSNGPIRGVADIPLKDTPTKDKNASATKSEETGKFSVVCSKFECVDVHASVNMILCAFSVCN